MNENTHLRLEALYSQPLLQYLSREEMGRLRQVNKELYDSSRLKKTLLIQGKAWFLDEFWWDDDKDAIRDANSVKKLRKVLLKLMFNQHVKKNYSNDVYSFYLFLGGTLSFELIFDKAQQERGRENVRDCAINVFTCAPRCCCYNANCDRGYSFMGLNTFSILCLTLPFCVPSASCSWLMYTGIGMLSTTTAGTTLSCLEKECHIFTRCCEPLTQLEKAEKTNIHNQAPAQIEMLDDEAASPVEAVIPIQRNTLANCFKGLFSRQNKAPNELSPLVAENNSCEGKDNYARNTL